MPKQSSKWTMTVYHEENGELQVRFEGPSNKANDMLALEAAIRGLKTWDIEPHFKDGVAPKKMKRERIPVSIDFILFSYQLPNTFFFSP